MSALTKDDWKELKAAQERIDEALEGVQGVITAAQERYDELSAKSQEGLQGSVMQDALAELETLESHCQSASDAIGSLLMNKVA